MNGQYWQESGLQFPRLLAEINAVGLTDAQTVALCQSMDLQPHNIRDLLGRAEETWERIKGTPDAAEHIMRGVLPPLRCCLCNHWERDKDELHAIDGKDGTCRCRAPKGVCLGASGMDLDTQWPRTRSTEWCGEATARRGGSHA